MALDNLISISFTQQELTDMDSALLVIENILKGKVVNLTSEERTQFGKISTKREDWVNRVTGYMVQKPEIIPTFVDKVETDKDVAARTALLPRLKRLASITDSMEDTTKLISSDVFGVATAVYQNVRFLSTKNVAGISPIYEDLKKQFPGRPSSPPKS